MIFSLRDLTPSYRAEPLAKHRLDLKPQLNTHLDIRQESPMNVAVQSIFKDESGWQLLEVEVQLVRGLPKLQILGRADSSIKEATLKLKSIFDQLGWPWPKHQQIVVNLRPSYLRKMSAGLDLPIAIGIAQAMGMNFDQFKSQGVLIAYGELSLSGQLLTPDDLEFWPIDLIQRPVLTGLCKAPLPFDTYQARTLKDLAQSVLQPKKALSDFIHRPSLSCLKWPKPVARLLEVLAVGQHHALLAGPAGSGKTTLINEYQALLPPPTEHTFHTTRIMHKERGHDLQWRPVIQPHHSISSTAMTGGGIPLRPGAVSLAHGGVLVLDEYLEFDAKIQESLREPIEKKTISIWRGGKSQLLPANFQLLATTNLCPCGKWVPDPTSQVSCRFSASKCRATLQRLSGPMLDRFDILSLSHRWQTFEERIETAHIFDLVQKASEFQRQRQGESANKDLEFDALESFLHPHVKDCLPGPEFSLRRRRALLRVARTIADLDLSENILKRHLNEAMGLAVHPFLEIEKYH